MRRALALALACCTPKETAAPTDASPVGMDVGFVHAFSPSATDAGPAVFDAGDPSLVLGSRAKSGKSVGHTSVVFKITLENGNDICFKPESKRGKTRYRGEVGASRLADALGLHAVIPAMVRAFPASELRQALDPKARELFDGEVIIKNGEVRGAAMQWLKKMEFIPLEGAPWRARWSAWLGAGEIPAEDRALAAQISNLVVFDLLTGNWDRWSGANVAIDRATNTLLFVDNDGAFFDPPPAPFLAQQTALVKKTERFSRALIDALRKLEPERLADVLGEDLGGEPLFSARVVAGVAERRKLVLDHVDARVSKDGEAAVYAFP